MDEIIPPWTRYASYMSLMRCLDDDAAVEQLRRSTVGLYVVVGRAWRHLIDRKEQTAPEGIAYVSHFIGWRHKISSNSQAFEDLMIGTGGTPTGLAAIVVSHIKFCFPNPDSCVTDYTISCLGSVLCLFAPQKVPGPHDIVFKDALLSHGLIAAAITAARALCRSTLACANFEVTAIFLAVVIQLTSCPTMWIPEALRAGLLEILFTSHHRKYISSGFVTLLKDVLSPATVYHSVLSELQTSFPQVRNRKAGAIFEDPGLLVYWDRFVELVENRLPILDEYDAGVLLATRVCDNVEVISAPEFAPRRSSNAVVLASLRITVPHHAKPMTGGEVDIARHVVIFLRAEKVDLFTPTLFVSDTGRAETSHTSARDRSFFRALVHHEYATRREEIEQRHLDITQFWRGVQCATVFDFSTGACNIEIEPLDVLKQSRFDFDVERVTQSGGQMQLLLAKVLLGLEHRLWIFPLRSTESEEID
ncbi:hypothetical protein B0H13DRAFT_1865711 [Mycena leptocephala]|nr:hypothetical protein B0H13DRAFT_1865711 [Mycena leptocephala]